MNVDIVMIAIGPAFTRMAEVSVPLVEKHIGPVTVHCDDRIDAFDLKLRLLAFSDRPVLYVDADALVLSWDWAPFRPGVFNAVDDYPCQHATWSRYLVPLWPLEHAINAGLWLADESHADVFRLADELAQGELKDHPRRLGDQTPLNTALYRMGTEINRLPREYNRQISAKGQPMPEGARVVHVVGDSRPGESMYGQDHKLARFFAAAKTLGVL